MNNVNLRMRWLYFPDRNYHQFIYNLVMIFPKKLTFLIFLFFVSCKTPQVGSGGGGGGSVPTANDLNDYIDRMTTPENKTCGDVRTDSRSESSILSFIHLENFNGKMNFQKALQINSTKTICAL